MTPSVDAVDQSEEIISDLQTQYISRRLKIPVEELRLSEQIGERLLSMAESARQGNPASYDDLASALNAIAEENDCLYGIPIPSIRGDSQSIGGMVVAPRAALSRSVMLNQHFRTDAEERHVRRGDLVRNSWEHLGDVSVVVVNTTDGPMALPEPLAGSRFRKMFDTLDARLGSQLTAESEFKALSSLEQKISKHQFKCYMLNNCFLERSKRSDLHYVFRKGFPTVVISYHGWPEGRILAALCLHPFGYHSGTFAGFMTPTDEVICALLLMRSDEPFLWRKSGQWRASDLRSGL